MAPVVGAFEKRLEACCNRGSRPDILERRRIRRVRSLHAGQKHEVTAQRSRVPRVRAQSDRGVGCAAATGDPLPSGGLRNGMGYCGTQNIEALRKNARFIRVSAASVAESHPHDITITHEAPNYHSMPDGTDF